MEYPFDDYLNDMPELPRSYMSEEDIFEEMKVKKVAEMKARNIWQQKATLYYQQLNY